MTSKLPLSVAIITLNEEDNLPRCLESVKDVASEIVVIDSGSVDATAALAEEYGARVLGRDWPGYTVQKNRAMEACTQPWVLSLDADEALSEDLANELCHLFAAGAPPSTATG